MIRMNTETKKRSWFARIRLWIWRCTKCLLLVTILYGLFLLAGIIPVNNDFVEDPEGVEIFVVSNDVHAEIIVPVEHLKHSWRSFFDHCNYQSRFGDSQFVGFGWGDRDFFVNTPTWDDFKLSTASRAAFLPTSCVMRVDLFPKHRHIPSTARSVTISDEHYVELVSFIESSFQYNNQCPIELDDPGYAELDAFFHATGIYCAFNTCNSWVGRALKTAGVRVGWQTPLPQTVFLYLPE